MNKQELTFAHHPETPSFRLVIEAIMKKNNLWVQRYRSRQLLARLDDRMLSDVGLTRSDAYTESDKPFWKA